MARLTVRGGARIDLVRMACERCQASIEAELPIAEAWVDAHLAPVVRAAHGRIPVPDGRIVLGWWYPAGRIVVPDPEWWDGQRGAA